MAHSADVKVKVSVTMHLFNVYGLVAGLGLLAAGLLVAYDRPWGIVAMGAGTLIYFIVKMLRPRNMDETVKEISFP